MIHLPRLIFLPLLLLALVPAARATAPVAPDRVTAREDWYVVEMQGQRSGWMREFVRPLDGDRFETGMEMSLVFGRAGMQATVGLETSFIETADGEAIEMSMTQRLGQVPTSTRFVFGEEELTVTSVNGAQQFTQTMPLPAGEWMTPIQGYRHIKERLAAGDTAITTRLVTALTGPAVVEAVMRLEGEENIEVFGRTVSALRTMVESSMAPGQPGLQYTDLEGRALRSEMNFGAMKMVVLAADKQLALAKADPPEMMASTFVKPTGVRLEDPRRASHAVYTLRTTNGSPIPAFEGGAQTATTEPDGRVRVRVSLSTRDETPAGPEYLESSSMIAADDPVVRQLVERALEGTPDTEADRAAALREFVHGFIDEKNLGVGFASASETARTRTGDCTEHGVLLAAMLRAAGIPSRLVSGLVYTQAFAGAEDVFGYHVWTQAHVNGRWIDLDATIGGTPFDAAHIALSSTAMREGEFVNAMVEIAPLIGALRIEVEEIR